MSLQEYSDNRYTKEKDEVESYLLRIIQRYFDIENNYSRESIESMILEALTRFKQIIVAETGYLFSLNQMTGQFTLSIRDFNGEPAFEKNTAFNKDFGTTAGTICAGDDERLNNERIPLEHVQTIDDVKNLREALSQVTLPTKGSSHSHKNKQLLDILNYTGVQTQIDLIALEQLEQAIENHCGKFTNYKQELAVIQKDGIEKLQAFMGQTKQIVVNAKELTDNAIKWLPEAYSYTDTKMRPWRLEVLKNILGYITKEQAQTVIDALKKSYYKVAEDEVLLQNSNFTFVPIQQDGYTNICETRSVTFDVTTQMQSASNSKIELYFRYEKDGQTITIPLPFYYKNDNCTAVIQGIYTENGLVIITSKFMYNLPFYITDNNMYNDNTIIMADNVNTNVLYWTQIKLQDNNCTLCTIDSMAKHNFVAGLLQQDTKYYIDGERDFIDNKFYDKDGNELTFFNWKAGHPVEDNDSIVIVNSTWESVDQNDDYGCVAEHELKRLAQYFENPRVYYKIVGNKEGM